MPGGQAELLLVPQAFGTIKVPEGPPDERFVHLRSTPARQAPTPTYPPEQVAPTLANLVHPRREVVIGQSGKALELAHVLAPGLVDRILGSRATRNQFAGDEPAEEAPGNVFEPDPAWTTASGNWPTVNRKRRALALPIAAAVTATAVLATRRAVFRH